MLELTAQQIAVLERLASRGFQAVAFPLYGNAVGVRRGNCGALLVPVAGGGLGFMGAPSYLLEGNLCVRVTRGQKNWFVWKTKQVEATPERVAELKLFAADLAELLLRTA